MVTQTQAAATPNLEAVHAARQHLAHAYGLLLEAATTQDHIYRNSAYVLLQMRSLLDPDGHRPPRYHRRRLQDEVRYVLGQLARAEPGCQCNEWTYPNPTCPLHGLEG